MQNKAAAIYIMVSVWQPQPLCRSKRARGLFPTTQLKTRRHAGTPEHQPYVSASHGGVDRSASHRLQRGPCVVHGPREG